MKRRSVASMLMLAILLAWATSAWADTIDVNNFNYGDTVKVKIGRSFKEWVATAEINLDLVGTWDSVYGYCVDPMQGVGTGEYAGYDIYTPSEAYDYAAQIYSQEGGLAAAYLVSAFSTSLQGTGTTSYLDITALQVAIWEVIYDYDSSNPNSLNLTSGTFRFLGTTNLGYNTVLARANQMLDAVKNYEFTAEQIAALDEYFRVGVSGGHQDLVFGTTGGGGDGTPEPGTLLLLGSAMAVGGYLRRKRTLAKTA